MKIALDSLTWHLTGPIRAMWAAETALGLSCVGVVPYDSSEDEEMQWGEVEARSQADMHALLAIAARVPTAVLECRGHGPSVSFALSPARHEVYIAEQAVADELSSRIKRAQAVLGGRDAA
jgi:hypothetical protein